MYPKIRRATSEDVNRIIAISRQYRDELGFVQKVALCERISRKTVLVTELDGYICGFVDYYARLDGWQTVRHLAVDKHFIGQGIGRQLLYAIPCPIRLKVTVDNPANSFYAGAGMQYIRTEPGKKRPLNVYELKTMFALVKGNAPKIPELARASGMAYGIRGDCKAYAWPFMVDVDFEAYQRGDMTWGDYLDQVRANNPVQAMVVDYGLEGQPNRRVLYEQIRDLRSLGILRIMVCPKADYAIGHTPSWCITALSVPSSYAGWLPDDFKTLKGRRLHLLGGEVRLQRKIAAMAAVCGGKVISMDGSHHTVAAAHGRVFTGGRFVQTYGNPTNDLIAESGAQITRFVQAAPEQIPLAL